MFTCWALSIWTGTQQELKENVVLSAFMINSMNNRDGRKTENAKVEKLGESGRK